MSLLHHPAFQSLVLPFVLSVLACLLLRLAGPRWGPLGAALGLVLSMLVWPGFDWPATSRVQALPWLAMGSTLLVALAMALNAPGSRDMPRPAGLAVSVLLTLVALALTAWAALGGSLLLAQLALMLATVAGVSVLWSWRSAAASLLSTLPLWLTGIGIALCLAWLPPAASSGGGADAEDDPYYEPRWK